MTRTELGQGVLKSVSRSFYLTIRLLPPALREPIGLAYLLARTSDTIADSAATPAEVRVRQLADFARLVEGDRSVRAEDVSAGVQPATEGERVLLTQVPACLQWLEALAEQDREEIRAVLRKIIQGQTLDLQRFAGAGPGQIRALGTAAELEEYTYLVAGCVGEFWTRLCLAHLPGYTSLAPEELVRIGVGFGKGLQFVNILRDLPRDLRDGRCYLPADGLSAAGLSPEELLTRPEAGRALFGRWLARGRECLQDGARYVRAIHPLRVRMACFLPWHLGEKTMALVAAHPPLETAQRVKVPRREVYGALPRAVMAGLCNCAVPVPKESAA